MDRYKFLPCYHYVENEDGDIQNPATDKVRTCTIYGNHGKNLIPYPFTNSTKTINGITLTDNGDGTITANGTATDGKAELVIAGKASHITIKANTKYTLSGTPSGGASNKWYMYLLGLDALVTDMGNGGTFTGGDTDTTAGGLIVRVSQGATVENIVFKPMLEESETKTDFEPWCGVGDKTKNLIPYPYSDTTKTVSGVTFTDNGDGSITANGTATGDGASFATVFNSSGLVGQGTYYLSGCPSNGGSKVSLQPKIDNEWDYSNYDFGSGKVITVQSKLTNIACVIAAGTTVDNLTFHPMLIDLDARNLIPYPYARTTQTISGVTLTDNGDGSITVNGTATANVWYPISTRTASTIYATKGKYYLSGCPNGGSGNKYWLQCDIYNDTTQIGGFYDAGNGKTQDLSAYNITTLSVNIHVNSGTTVDNLTFRPLLVNMDDISSYEPYGYKIPVANDTRKNLLNVDDFTATQTNSYYASKIITLTDSDMSTYLPHLDEMKGKSVVCSYDFDNEKFIQEFLIYFNETVNGSSNYIAFSNSNNFTTTLPDATPIRLEIRARSNSADLNGTTVKISNISLKLADVDPETTNIYTPKQIMQGESATFNKPFKLSKANQLSVETAVKPSAVKYTYYTY